MSQDKYYSPTEVGALIEDLSSQFRTFGEGLSAVRTDLDEFRTEVRGRFDQFVTRQEFQLALRNVHHEIQDVKHELKAELKAELKTVHKRFDHFFNVISDHEERITHSEQLSPPSS